MARGAPPALREQAADEWQEVLDSPFSPVPFLTATLEQDWEDLDLSPDAVVERFLDELQLLIGEIEAE